MLKISSKIVQLLTKKTLSLITFLGDKKAINENELLRSKPDLILLK